LKENYMPSTVRNAISPKRVRFQIQARRVERADESAWFDMEEIRPMSRKASDQAVSDLNRGVPAFAYRAVAV
jgi:hypothetical protein